MLHSVEDITKKVGVMYSKAMVLQRLRYDTPAEHRDHVVIAALIDDIRALAGDIYNDRSRYEDCDRSDVA
jgi:hypothetical protein